ncbi:hypothetical protein ACFTWH_28500 [Streptomyces sp. NPDC057011]|uniref:hypothetical protein n=1 Tax=unclassified Streptomyces TaxID=2593676 RepID=UPI003642E77C
MAMGRGPDDEADLWETAVVGRRFVDVLNEGLIRSAGLLTRTPARGQAPGWQRAGHEPSDPFAAAVLSGYEEALGAALAPGERHDRELRAVLLRRGREVLAQAQLLAGRPAGDGETPVPRRLSPEQESMVLSLLTGCAVLAALRDEPPWPPECRPADLIKTLGRLAGQAPATAGTG